MSERARYTKLDFVDYFKAFTQVQDEWVEQLISQPKCLAILDAFAAGRMRLDYAMLFLADEWPQHGHVIEMTLKQSARRYDLPKEDNRHIHVGVDVKEKYSKSLIEMIASGGAEERLRSKSYSKTNEIGWGSIRADEQRQYADYWKVANFEEYDALLANRPLLAKIDAFNRRLDNMEPWDHVIDIEKFVSPDQLSLKGPLRSVVLAHLSRDIGFGIIEIPTNLRSEFPDIYAERGIA